LLLPCLTQQYSCWSSCGSFKSTLGSKCFSTLLPWSWSFLLLHWSWISGYLGVNLLSRSSLLPLNKIQLPAFFLSGSKSSWAGTPIWLICLERSCLGSISLGVSFSTSLAFFHLRSQISEPGIKSWLDSYFFISLSLCLSLFLLTFLSLFATFRWNSICWHGVFTVFLGGVVLFLCQRFIQAIKVGSDPKERKVQAVLKKVIFDLIWFDFPLSSCP